MTLQQISYAYLADVIAEVQLTPGGRFWPLRNPSALELVALRKAQTATPGDSDQWTLSVDLLLTLFPEEAGAEVRAMPPKQVAAVVQLSAIGVEAVNKFAEDAAPNGERGVTRTPASPPATPSDTWQPSSPEVLAGLHGRS